MKQFLNKIIAVSMSIVVLLSTMSFTVSQHYCGDYLVDSALFSKAESCGMEMEKPSPNKDCSLTKKNCCSDILTQIDGQSELKIDVAHLNFEQQVFVAALSYSYIQLFEGIEENSVPFKYYSPPLLVKDLQLLDEVFLI
jgi:hypothetical protein